MILLLLVLSVRFGGNYQNVDACFSTQSSPTPQPIITTTITPEETTTTTVETTTTPQEVTTMMVAVETTTMQPIETTAIPEVTTMGSETTIFPEMSTIEPVEMTTMEMSESSTTESVESTTVEIFGDPPIWTGGFRVLNSVTEDTDDGSNEKATWTDGNEKHNDDNVNDNTINTETQENQETPITPEPTADQPELSFSTDDSSSFTFTDRIGAIHTASCPCEKLKIGSEVDCPSGNVCSSPTSNCQYTYCGEGEKLHATSRGSNETMDVPMLICDGSWKFGGVKYTDAICKKSCDSCETLDYDKSICPKGSYFCDKGARPLIYTSTSNGCGRVQCANPNSEIWSVDGPLTSQPVCTGDSYSTPEISKVGKVVCARKCSCSLTKFNPVVPLGISSVRLRQSHLSNSKTCYSRYSGCPRGSALRLTATDGSVIFVPAEEAYSKKLECSDGKHLQTIVGNTRVSVENYTCFAGGCSSCTFSIKSSRIIASVTHDDQHFCAKLTLLGCPNGFKKNGTRERIHSQLHCEYFEGVPTWRFGYKKHAGRLDIDCA